jgi:hypothetical protein
MNDQERRWLEFCYNQGVGLSELKHLMDYLGFAAETRKAMCRVYRRMLRVMTLVMMALLAAFGCGVPRAPASEEEIIALMENK